MLRCSTHEAAIVRSQVRVSWQRSNHRQGWPRIAPEANTRPILWLDRKTGSSKSIIGFEQDSGTYAKRTMGYWMDVVAMACIAVILLLQTVLCQMLRGRDHERARRLARDVLDKSGDPACLRDLAEFEKALGSGNGIDKAAKSSPGRISEERPDQGPG